jgi:steroid 5-alpha reductase family enzyme
MASRTRSSRPHTGLAVPLAVVGVAAVPAAIAAARYFTEVSLLDAAWAIPVAAVASVSALLLVRGARGHVRVGSLRGARLARFLGVAGVCVMLAATIAVGFYEVLLRLEG